MTDTGARSIRKKQTSVNRVPAFQGCPRDRQSFLVANVVAIDTPVRGRVCQSDIQPQLWYTVSNTAGIHCMAV